MLQFIKESKRKLSKNEIAKYMSSEAKPELYRVSKKTAYKMIDEAAESGSIKVTKHLRQGQNDEIEFNDKNNFNILMSMIEETEKLINEFNIAIRDDREPKKLTKLNRDRRNVNEIFVQNVYVTIISSIAFVAKSSINNVSDREVLYSRLVEPLIISHAYGEALVSGFAQLLLEEKMTAEEFIPQFPRHFIENIFKLNEMFSDLRRMGLPFPAPKLKIT